MYMFNVDESGTRDPDCGKQPNGDCAKNWLYVLTAVGIFEHRWKSFYRVIVKRKRELLARLNSVHGLNLDLDSTEIKSNWIRIPKERPAHPFLSYLTDPDIQALVALYYDQLAQMNVPVISVLIDKRYLTPGVDGNWVQTKAWEYLCERVEMFMLREHPKHRAVLVADDCGKTQNCALAMRHARFLEKATTANRRLDHIVEMPLFVRSELSEGVQLADLCTYSIYRAFRDSNLEYSYFEPVFEQVYRPQRGGATTGLKIFPNESPLRALLGAKSGVGNEKGRPSIQPDLPLELVSGGANPIELQAAPDRKR